MFVVDFVVLLPFFFGVFLGVHAILRPAARPNFEGLFKRRYPRTEWNERNPESFTRRAGWMVFGASMAYGALVLVPWVFR